MNGPIHVYDLTGRLLSTVKPVGTVRDIALAWPRLSMIVERPNGTKEIGRYNASTGKRLLGMTGLGRIPLAATDLGASDAGLVFRVGSRIYFLGSHERTLRRVQQAQGTPIGLSIESRRIAWAVNIKGRGRIVALTLR